MSLQSEIPIPQTTVKQEREIHTPPHSHPEAGEGAVKAAKDIVQTNRQPRSTKSWWADLLWASVIPVVVVVLWQWAGGAGWISPEFMPTPWVILNSLIHLVASGDLAYHIGVSIQRTLLGFAIGGLLGLVLGCFTGMFRKAEYLLDPSIQVLRLVPHLAIAPLIILWFGFGETSKIAIIISGSFFPMYINTYAGIRQVDGKWFEVGRVLEFKPYQRFTRLIVPGALPSILLGVRLSLAVSWISLVVAELVGSTAGIGFMINEAKQNSDTPVIFVGILIFAVVGKLIDSLVRLLERRWLHWRDAYRG
ncbi:sulfonate transport system permease protein [Paenibacillus rhizosphaerae]|uniref:Sulfonate transport system permease protein n=1 Tax=Paenibacillus rhizosphaerae TaxID=297318 RepID=A0A839TMV8_9BACL|nr:ABC transporter permease [Paenibacillus rhizosphaerae]MBB3126689.1 sulfonate transport system permease protein [Paenibacillus rhizosphaerae]